MQLIIFALQLMAPAEREARVATEAIESRPTEFTPRKSPRLS